MKRATESASFGKMMRGYAPPRSLSKAPFVEMSSAPSVSHRSRFSQSSMGPPSPGCTATMRRGLGAFAISGTAPSFFVPSKFSAASANWEPHGLSTGAPSAAALSSIVDNVAVVKARPGHASRATSSSFRSANASHSDSPSSLASGAASSMAQSLLAFRIWTLSTSSNSVFVPRRGGNSTSPKVTLFASAKLIAPSAFSRTAASGLARIPAFTSYWLIPFGSGER
mmetsp:Transcript_18461/g.62260  ORF Transcript_18461/g.62260 Transcript_18461/m.62260 type:complete len:225 (+) Transcript_18461:188-862(+)